MIMSCYIIFIMFMFMLFYILCEERVENLPFGMWTNDVYVIINNFVRIKSLPFDTFKGH